MTKISRLIAVFLLVLAAPASAAEVIYPPGSRIGIAPPAGLSVSNSFSGYEDREHRVAIILGALPAEAFAEIEKTSTPEALKKQGIGLETREELSLPPGRAVLIIGREQAGTESIRKWLMFAAMPELTALVTVQMPDAARSTYPDAAIRAAISSLAMRQTVPVEEQLSLLPFRVGELAGFGVSAVLPGRALILSDATATSAAPNAEPHIIVAVAPGGPQQADDRGNFARDLFRSIPNIKDVRINAAEPLRIGGQPGHEILAMAKDQATGEEVTVVQWLRFGSGAYLHLVGVARESEWTKSYGRFRSVRDGIDLH
jgi:hypothetical protein